MLAITGVENFIVAGFLLLSDVGQGKFPGRLPSHGVDQLYPADRIFRQGHQPAFTLAEFEFIDIPLHDVDDFLVCGQGFHL